MSNPSPSPKVQPGRVKPRPDPNLSPSSRLESGHRPFSFLSRNQLWGCARAAAYRRYGRSRTFPALLRHGWEAAADSRRPAHAPSLPVAPRRVSRLRAPEAAGEGLRLGAGRGRGGREVGVRQRGGGVGGGWNACAQLQGGARGRRQAAPARALQLLQRQQLRGERRRGGLLLPVRPRICTAPRRGRLGIRGSRGFGAEREHGGAEPSGQRVPDRGEVRQDLEGQGGVPPRGGGRAQVPRLRRRRLQVALGEDPLLPLQLKDIAFFYAELLLVQYTMLIYPTSLTVAAAVYAARCALNTTPRWREPPSGVVGVCEAAGKPALDGTREQAEGGLHQVVQSQAWLRVGLCVLRLL